MGYGVARLSVKNGYNVVISNSRGPETLADLVAELGPLARAATPAEAAQAGDIVVVTIPLKNLRDVPVAPLAGKIVRSSDSSAGAADADRSRMASVSLARPKP